MVNLKDLGVSLHYFAPLPNSIIVGRFKMGEIDLEQARKIFEDVRQVFTDQNPQNNVIFIPSSITLQRMSIAELRAVKDHIDTFIKYRTGVGNADM